jgi:hypothetical protein
MTRAKRSGGMAQAGQHLTKHAQSPEFKPQYHIKRKKKKKPTKSNSAAFTSKSLIQHITNNFN